jgi:hypothetical protein
MSLAGKIKDAFNGKVEDALAITEALDAKSKAEAQQAKLFAKVDAARNGLVRAESTLANAALESEASGDTRAYDAAKADVLKLRADVERLEEATNAAAAKITAAQNALVEAGHERTLRHIRKEANLVSKHATAFADHLANVIKEYEALLTHTDRLATASPVALYGLGLAISQEDIGRLIAGELARLQPNGRPGYVFPGSEYPIYGDVRETTPFVEAIAQSNERILALVAEGPAAEPLQPAPAPVVPSDPDGAQLNEEPADAPTKFETINPNPTAFEPVPLKRSYSRNTAGAWEE